MPSTPQDAAITQVAGWLQPFMQALDSQGINAKQMLAEAGISETLIYDEGARIAVSEMDRLWRTAFSKGANLALGLDYARHFQPGNLYALSFGLYAARNLMQATEHLSLPLRLLTDAAVVHCHVDGEYFLVEVEATYPGSVLEKQFFFHAVLLGIWRSLSTPDLRPAKLEIFGLPAPHDPDVQNRLQQFFGDEVQFASTHSRLYLPLTVAQQDLHTANTTLIREGERVIDQQLALLDHSRKLDNIVAKVITRLSSGRFDRKSVAHDLGISESRLQRLLKAQDTSFSELVNKTRRDLAEHHLRSSPRPIKEVAYSLGFADLSNFNRAFRGWFGVSPREFRRQLDEA